MRYELSSAEWDDLAQDAAGDLARDERDRLNAALAARMARALEALGPLDDDRSSGAHVAAKARLLARLVDEQTANAGQPVTQTTRPVRRAAHAHTHGTRRTRMGWVTAIAACAVITGVAMPAIRRFVPTGAKTSAQVREYRTATAQQASIDLPDGSHVLMAPSTTLRYQVAISGTRLVELTGQAYFTVTPKAAQPFNVRTGSVDTRVLGTEFTVRRYETDSVAQIAVVTGKVAVNGTHTQSERPLILSAGTVGYVGDSSATMVDAGAEDVAAWTRGDLVFSRTALPRILDVLGRWYGYEFRLADPALAKRHLTVSFPVGKPKGAMRTLATLLDVTLSIDGTIVTLHAIPGASRNASPDASPGASRDPGDVHAPRRTHPPFPSFSTEVGK